MHIIASLFLFDIFGATRSILVFVLMAHEVRYIVGPPSGRRFGLRLSTSPVKYRAFSINDMRFNVVKSFKRLAILGSVLALGGCADLEKLANDAQKIVAAPGGGLTAEALPDICKALKENEARASSQYEGKFLTAKAVVKSIKEVGVGYTVFLDPVGIRSINIFAAPRTKSALMSISTGQVVTVSGAIRGLSLSGGPAQCGIHMENATF